MLSAIARDQLILVTLYESTRLVSKINQSTVYIKYNELFIITPLFY